MSNATSNRPFLLAALASILLTLGTGCARTVTFAVVRPAMINLTSQGNAVSVGAIQPNGNPEAAADVAADLQGRIAHSLNPTIRLVREGGVTVDGAILEDSYQEHTETVSQTCSRQVQSGTDSDGNPTYTSESYDCSYDITVGVAVSRARFRVLEAGGAHQVLFEQEYRNSDSTTGPSREAIQRLRHGTRDMSVDQFAKVILPWQDTVTERFKDCDGDTRCRQGFDLAKNADLATAEALFSQVIGAYGPGSTVPAAQTKKIGEAYYNRGVIRAHLRHYDEAVSDLKTAISLQPKRAKWPNELTSVKQMAQDTEALRKQGVAVR